MEGVPTKKLRGYLYLQFQVSKPSKVSYWTMTEALFNCIKY